MASWMHPTTQAAPGLASSTLRASCFLRRINDGVGVDFQVRSALHTDTTSYLYFDVFVKDGYRYKYEYVLRGHGPYEVSTSICLPYARL
jgi:hypothetical protein